MLHTFVIGFVWLKSLWGLLSMFNVSQRVIVFLIEERKMVVKGSFEIGMV